MKQHFLCSTCKTSVWQSTEFLQTACSLWELFIWKNNTQYSSSLLAFFFDFFFLSGIFCGRYSKRAFEVPSEQFDQKITLIEIERYFILCKIESFWCDVSCSLQLDNFQFVWILSINEHIQNYFLFHHLLLDPYKHTLHPSLTPFLLLACVPPLVMLVKRSSQLRIERKSSTR